MLVRPGSGRGIARRAALGTVAASVAVVGLPTTAQAAAPTTPFISEIHYDNAGTDAGEFVEVTFPGDSSVDRLGRRPLQRLQRGAVTTPSPLVPDAEGIAAVSYDGTLQNGSPDGVALIDPAGAVAEFLSYEGEMTATGVDGDRRGRAPTSASASPGASRPA